MDDTQGVESTQVISTPHALFEEEIGQTRGENTVDESIISRGVDTQVLKGILEQNSDPIPVAKIAWSPDQEMLGM